VVAFINGQSAVLGAGKLNAGAMRDWQTIDLPLSAFPKEIPEQIEVWFQANTDVPPALPLGVVGYQRLTSGKDPFAEVGGAPFSPESQLGLTLSYRH
jgi:hypothetical protein